MLYQLSYSRSLLNLGRVDNSYFDPSDLTNSGGQILSRTSAY